MEITIPLWIFGLLTIGLFYLLSLLGRLLGLERLIENIMKSTKLKKSTKKPKGEYKCKTE